MTHNKFEILSLKFAFYHFFSGCEELSLRSGVLLSSSEEPDRRLVIVHNHPYVQLLLPFHRGVRLLDRTTVNVLIVYLEIESGNGFSSEESLKLDGLGLILLDADGAFERVHSDLLVTLRLLGAECVQTLTFVVHCHALVLVVVVDEPLEQVSPLKCLILLQLELVLLLHVVLRVGLKLREAPDCLTEVLAPLPENDTGLPQEVNSIRPESNKKVRSLNCETQFDRIHTVDSDEGQVVHPVPF